MASVSTRGCFSSSRSSTASVASSRFRSSSLDWPCTTQIGTSLSSHVYGRQSSGPSAVVIQHGRSSSSQSCVNSTPQRFRISGVCMLSPPPAPNQPRTFLPDSCSQPRKAPPDLRLLVLDLLERALEPAVTHQLPARIHRGLGERRIDVRALRVDEGRRLDAALPQHVEQARHAAAHAVLDPGVVGQVGRLDLGPVRRRQDAARHRPVERPILDIDHRIAE